MLGHDWHFPFGNRPFFNYRKISALFHWCFSLLLFSLLIMYLEYQGLFPCSYIIILSSFISPSFIVWVCLPFSILYAGFTSSAQSLIGEPRDDCWGSFSYLVSIFSLGKLIQALNTASYLCSGFLIPHVQSLYFSPEVSLPSWYFS